MTAHRLLPGSDPLRVMASALALLLICVPFTIGAIWAFPIWDDAFVWLLIKEHGVGALIPAHIDRPVMARVWLLLATSEETLWCAAFVAQALLWPALGILSALLWNHLFPHLRQYAIVIACVASAPFLTQVHMLTLTISLGPLLSVILGYCALLLLLRFIRADDGFGRVALALSLPLLGFAIVITEYALPVVMIMLVLFFSYARDPFHPAARIRAILVSVLSTLIAGAAYTAYSLMAEPGARPDVHPLHFLKFGAYHFLRLPFELTSAMWRGVLGGLGTSLGQVHWTSKAGLAATVYGAVVAALLVYGCRNRRSDTPPAEGFRYGRGVFLLVLALGVGLIPTVAMNRRPWDVDDGMSSRFGLPVLPITAALMVLIGIGLVRERFGAILIIIVGFAAGNATLTAVWSAVQERTAMTIVGNALQAHMSSSDGYTVAVIAAPDRTLGPQHPWELTARLAATWPSEVRDKFWAYREDQAARIFGTRGDCRRPSEINVTISMGPTFHRLVTRKGQLDHLLWVARRPDGTPAIEPYCLRGMPAAQG
jgi:hypothetical protein